MRYINLYLLLLLGLASCGGKVKQDNTVSAPAPVKDTVTQAPKPIAYHDETPRYDPAIADYLTKLKAQYSRIPMYFKEDGHFYFYVVNGEWEAYGYAADETSFEMGIINENFDTILPPVYHKIYMPDATAKGYVEIEKDNKLGLLNYRTKQLIAPSFDVIFPSTKTGIIAIGKRGNQHYNIFTDGNEQLITDKAKMPTYLGLQKELAFDIKNPKWHYLIDSYVEYFIYQGDTTYDYGRGIIVPPSYLLATNFIGEYISELNIDNSGTEGSLNAYRNHIELTKTTAWGIDLLISDFYEEAIDGRGYIIQRKEIAGVDSVNNIKGKTTLYEVDMDFSGLCAFPEKPYRFIGDSLIEVQTFEVFYDVTVPTSVEYNGMTAYEYFEIGKDGSILKLESDRVFAFTRFAYITEAHFAGCYLVDKYSENSIKWPNNEDINYYVTHHLSVEDLDVMRNEIFADYGYKFKQEKWDKYFRAQPWYRPRFDNVDDKLKPWEKANLEVIKAAKEKLLKNPDKYINGHFESYFMAG